MTSYLGLDIGIASLGFALIEYDDKSKNGKIVTSGVRIFQEALTGKGEETKKPRNVTRRETALCGVKYFNLNQIARLGAIIAVLIYPNRNKIAIWKCRDFHIKLQTNGMYINGKLARCRHM
jgi:hypothetical protein